MLCECTDIEAFFLYHMIHGNGERVTTKRHEWRKARASFVPFGFWGVSRSAERDGGRRPLIALDGQKYILDMHIKHGVSAACLLRVYFCYDETLQKLIIGSMPEHLATVRCNT